MRVVTDDERRRVAERLRMSDERDAAGFVDCLLAEVVRGREFCETPCEECHARLLGELADLIEPEPERTCRVKSSHEVEGDGCYSYFEYELSCGHEMAWGDQFPPSYCPECGRRVLYDSDDYI